MLFRSLAFLPLSAAALIVTGCSGGSGSPTPPAATASLAAEGRTPPQIATSFSWLQPGIDSTHTADNTVERQLRRLNVATLKLGWSFGAASAGSQPILTSAPLAFANSGDGYLYAMSAKGGVKQWRFDTYATGESGLTSAAISGNLVYVGCDVGGNTQQQGLCAVAKGTGKLAWSWYEDCNCALPTSILVGPVVSGSTVVFGYFTGGPYGKDTLVALDTSSGALLWQVVAGSGQNSLAVSIPAIDGGNVFAGTDHGLCSLQLSSGSLNWCSGPNGGGMSPAVAGGTVFVTNSATNADAFYAFNETTGAQLWEYTPSTGYDGYYDPPAIAGSRVYFSMNQGGPVYALQVANGSLLFTAGGGSYNADAISSPAVANGVLYVACNAGLCAYNASTGASLASIGPGAAASSPAIANGRVYFGCGTRSGGLYPCMYDL